MISCEWVHQPDVDQAGDAILAEGNVTLDTITAYQVAEKLDRSANPSMYKKFRDWRARRQAEGKPVTVDVPPEVEATIRAIFARLTDDGVNALLGAVRDVGGSLDRVATMRVGDAERRADRAEGETADVVTIGERIEAELRAATIRIVELEKAVADAQRREDGMAGRLEQYKEDLAMALRHRPVVQIAPTDGSDGVDASDHKAGDAGDADHAVGTGGHDADAGEEREDTNSDPVTDSGDAGAVAAGDAASVNPAAAAAAQRMSQMVLRLQGIGVEHDDDSDAEADKKSGSSS